MVILNNCVTLFLPKMASVEWKSSLHVLLNYNKFISHKIFCSISRELDSLFVFSPLVNLNWYPLSFIILALDPLYLQKNFKFIMMSVNRIQGRKNSWVYFLFEFMVSLSSFSYFPLSLSNYSFCSLDLFRDFGLKLNLSFFCGLSLKPVPFAACTNVFQISISEPLFI